MTDEPVAGEPEIIVLDDPAAVAREAARRLVEALGRAIDTRGRADWSSTGGSAPGGIYRVLRQAPLRNAIDWRKVHLWWGDDRFVPRDHRLSNELIADALLLDVDALRGESGEGSEFIDVADGSDAAVPIPATNVHPWPTTESIGDGSGPEGCARRYADEAKTSLPMAGRWPVFDQILLGLGPDGHLLSVFPGSRAFDSDEIALAIPAPTHVEPHVERVTFNPALLDVTPSLLMVCHGESKADIVATVFGPERDQRQWPAQRARRAGAVWLLDRGAASELDRIAHRA